MPDEIPEDLRKETVTNLNEGAAAMIGRLTKLIDATSDPKVRAQAERSLKKYQALAKKLPKR